MKYMDVNSRRISLIQLTIVKHIMQLLIGTAESYPIMCVLFAEPNNWLKHGAIRAYDSHHSNPVSSAPDPVQIMNQTPMRLPFTKFFSPTATNNLPERSTRFINIVDLRGVFHLVLFHESVQNGNDTTNNLRVHSCTTTPFNVLKRLVFLFAKKPHPLLRWATICKRYTVLLLWI